MRYKNINVPIKYTNIHMMCVTVTDALPLKYSDLIKVAPNFNGPTNHFSYIRNYK